MLIKYTKKKGRLALFVLSVGLTSIAAVFGSMQHCPPCSTCVILSSDGKIMPPTPCHCTSYASYLFQSAFGHKERHSETMTKSTAPCEAKK
jgi:hypothetical protein